MAAAGKLMSLTDGRPGREKALQTNGLQGFEWCARQGVLTWWRKSSTRSPRKRRLGSVGWLVGVEWIGAAPTPLPGVGDASDGLERDFVTILAGTLAVNHQEV